VPVAAARPFVAIAAGASHTCASDVDGVTYCWGAGGADGGARPAPARVDGAPAFVTLAAGSVHTCGRTPPPLRCSLGGGRGHGGGGGWGGGRRGGLSS
jgi:hypothetical protein